MIGPLLGKLVIPGLALAALALVMTKPASAKTSSGDGTTPPGDVPERVIVLMEEARSSGDPRAIRVIADQLDKEGFHAQAGDLRKLADEIEAAQKVNPGASSPGILQTPAPGILSARVPAVLNPNPPETPGKITAQKMTLMLLNAPPGLEDQTLVTHYQMDAAKEGMYTGKIDGLYGPGAALTVAAYGIVPAKPRHWSRNKAIISAQKKAYAQALLKYASQDPQRADEWEQAADVRNL
jgi:hypothetical protein